MQFFRFNLKIHFAMHMLLSHILLQQKDYLHKFYTKPYIMNTT
jgi:hypothetical protein